MFSSQNIWRMKQFYESSKDTKKLSSLLREISWTNNLYILSATKSLEETEFYKRFGLRKGFYQGCLRGK